MLIVELKDQHPVLMFGVVAIVVDAFPMLFIPEVLYCTRPDEVQQLRARLCLGRE
jgi:hypothetical protein